MLCRSPSPLPHFLQMHWTALAFHYLKVPFMQTCISNFRPYSAQAACLAYTLPKFLVSQLVCHLTGCFIVTRVRVSVLTVLLTLSSKPIAFLWTPSSPRPLCLHQSLFTVPNYAEASMRNSWILQEGTGGGRRIIRNLVRFPFSTFAPLRHPASSACFRGFFNYWGSTPNCFPIRHQGGK